MSRHVAKALGFRADLLRLVFLGTPIPGVAIAAGLPASLQLSLHTADPTGGSQTTGEATYSNYARMAVPRGATGWTVTGDSVARAVNAALVRFPECGGDRAKITHVGIGTASRGAGRLLYACGLEEPLDVAPLIRPELVAGALSVIER